MKGEILMREMSGIGDDLILAAEEGAVCRHFEGKRCRRRLWIVAAACVAILSVVTPTAVWMTRLSPVSPGDRVGDGADENWVSPVDENVVWRDSDKTEGSDVQTPKSGEAETTWNEWRVTKALYRALTECGEKTVLAVLVRVDTPEMSARVRETVKEERSLSAGENIVIFLTVLRLKDWHFDGMDSCVLDLAAKADITE